MQKVSKKVRPCSKAHQRYLDLVTGYGMSTEVRTKTGFPVRVWMNVQPADFEVGINRSYVDEFVITTRNGFEVPWLKLSEDEQEDLVIKAREQLDVDEDFCEPDSYYD